MVRRKTDTSDRLPHSFFYSEWEGSLKRDMDLIRNILMEIEGGKNVYEALSDDMASILQISPETRMSQEQADELRGHLDLLEQAGFIEIDARLAGGVCYIKRLTWEGHDFLDSVRDPKIWDKTKQGAEAAGGFTVDLLKELAKGLVKKQIEEWTGVKL
jgi:hypothetical protein